MTAEEIFALTPCELDVAISEMLGMPVVHPSWPCGNAPDGGYEAAIRENDEASWWTDRRPVYAPDADMWPPKPIFPDNPDSPTWCDVEPVPRYSTDIAAAWKVYLHVMDQSFSVRRNFYAHLQEMTRDQAGGNLVAWPEVLTVLRHELPTAICRAALIVIRKEA